jgi:acyl-CoA synthetase (AMP-forming)/AMP-acid ligase II
MPALFFEGSMVSRGQLAESVTRLAARLEREGVTPGAKVVLALPNSPVSLVSMLAINACGAVFVPLNPHLTPDERRRIDGVAQPDFVLSEHGEIELTTGASLSRTRDRRQEADDLNGVAAIIFTSGTTGTPKGVMMAEEALVANARSVAGYLDLSSTDRTLVFLPLYYTYALSQVLSTWLAGGSIVLMRNLRYPMQALATIAARQVTGFGGVPTSLNLLTGLAAERGIDNAALRYVLSAGGPLAPALVERVRRAFPHASLFNNYGCTEIGPRATAINLSAYPDKPASIGRPIAGINATIVRPDLTVAGVGETGEIVLGGSSLMKGYYCNRNATLERTSHHGFHTGDYGHADADGFLYFEGRLDDIFKSGGEKVSAREIEDVLLAHDAVAEAAVVSVPDATLGAVPVAHAVLHPGSRCSERELRAFCAGRLSSYKVPRSVFFVEELRKTATGKVQKHLLKEAHS